MANVKVPTFPVPDSLTKWSAFYSEPVESSAVEQLDQGIDFKGLPNHYVYAIGDAHVDAVKSDPGGFGWAVYYTLKHGERAGQQIYVGHAKPLVAEGHTLKRWDRVCLLLEHPLGNATQPGWTEIGFAVNGAPEAAGSSDTGPANRFLGFLGGERVPALVSAKGPVTVPEFHKLPRDWHYMTAGELANYWRKHDWRVQTFNQQWHNLVRQFMHGPAKGKHNMSARAKGIRRGYH